MGGGGAVNANCNKALFAFYRRLTLSKANTLGHLNRWFATKRVDTCEARHAHVALSRRTGENGDVKTFTVVPDCAICLVRSFQFFL